MTRTKKYQLTLGLAAVLLLPQAVSAQATMPLFLGNVTLEQIIGRIIKLLLTLSGTLAMLVIIMGGFKWMTAQGNAEQVKKAKSTITLAIAGLIIAFSAYTLVDFIIKAL